MRGEARVTSLAPSSPDADAELIRRSATGDTMAFDTIVESHQAAIARFLVSLGMDDPDDALQDTFIAAWESAATYHGTGTVRNWLLSIARNVQRRSHRRRVSEPSDFVSLDVLAERAGWGADPAESRRVEIALARDVLTQALALLPDDEREILVLRELEGLSGEETAALLELTIPAMKSRLHRARLHLAAVLRHMDPSSATIRSAHVSE